MDTIDYLEWTGAGLGLLGAFLLATNTRASWLGWVAFLASNFALIAFALLISRSGLVLMQVGYLVTSLIGLWRSGRLQRKAPAM